MLEHRAKDEDAKTRSALRTLRTLRITMLCTRPKLLCECEANLSLFGDLKDSLFTFRSEDSPRVKLLPDWPSAARPSTAAKHDGRCSLNLGAAWRGAESTHRRDLRQGRGSYIVEIGRMEPPWFTIDVQG